MASKRISELPAAGDLDGSEQIPLTQDGETRRIPSNTYEEALNLVHDVTHADYGATGDGTTDDLAAIKSAVDTVEDAGGGIVFFPMPSAYYRITDTLVADEPVGVMLIGASREGCEIVPEGTNFAGAPVIQFLNAYHSGVQWLTVRGNSTDVPSALVEVRSVTATKGHAPTGFKAEHCMFGSTSAGSATYAIQWTFDTGEDANNDFGYVEDCQIANLDTAYRIEGVNSLEHNIFGGKVGANVATLVSFNGGSAQFFGTIFVPGLSGWVCDIEGNDYKHPIVFSGVQKESGDGILRAASTVDSNSGVNVRFTDCDLGDAQTDDTTVDFQAPNSVVSWVGTEAIAGVSGITHSYTASNTRASYVACRLDVSAFSWEGVLNLFGNHHDVGSVALTQGTDAVLTHLDESGGGPDGLTVGNKDYRRDDRPLVISQGSFETHAGSPAVVDVGNGRHAAWSLPESTGAERLGATIDVPASWSSFDIEIWHTTATGNSGDAACFVNLLQPAAGDSLANDDHASGVTAITAVATADTLGVATISSGVSVPSGNVLFALARDASQGADTLTGAFLILAVVLRKVS